MRSFFTLVAAGLVASAVAAPASATIIQAASNVALTSTPFTVNLGTGTFSFTAISPSSNTRQASVALATGGSGLVYGNGFLTQGIPDSFQQGTVIPDQLSLGQFFSTSGAQPIPFSIANTYVALSFLLNGNTHYAYGQVAGSTLVSVAFNDVPGGSIRAGEPGVSGAVPEPATWAMMFLGFGLAGVAMRRRGGRVALAS